MELSSDTETEWESETETEPKTILIQKKLIMKHKYVITIDGTNKTYYGTCQCPDSYLFSDVVKFESTHKYIGLNYFSEKDHFIDTHEKMD
jgi:hypothetical protein